MRCQQGTVVLASEDIGVCGELGSLLSVLSRGDRLRGRPSVEAGVCTPTPHSRMPRDCFRRSLEIVLNILSTSSDVGKVICAVPPLACNRLSHTSGNDKFSEMSVSSLS